jgi:hypothetical protein
MSTSTDKANVVDADRPEVVIDNKRVHIPMPAAEMVNQQVESAGILYVVPDGFYIPKENQQPPGWLVNIIGLVVRQYIDDNAADLADISAQVHAMLAQLAEMKEVYEKQEQIETQVAAQVNALITPLQNTIAGLTQRLVQLESSKVTLSDVHTAVEQRLDVVVDMTGLVEHNTKQRFTALEERVRLLETGELDYFSGILEIESEGNDTDFYNDDRMDITNEIIHVYSGRDIVLQIGDLSLPVMKHDDFEPEDDDDQNPLGP